MTPLLALVLPAFLVTQAAADTAASTALTGVTLIDGTGAAPQPGQTILLKGERISAIFPDGSQALASDVTRVDLTGRYVIPGLIDTHVHVATDPSKEDTRVRSERRLKKALYGGVTAVRDMAGDVRTLAALQRDARLGEIDSPDLYYVALFAGPEFFADPRTQDASRGLRAGAVPWMRAISDSTDLGQAVAEARGTGATAIKLYAALSAPLTRRIVAEAHRQGIPIWAHAALRPAQPLDVVEAGADVVSHASLFSRTSPAGLDSVFRSMKRRHTVLEPTLLVYEGRGEMLATAGKITRQAHAAGITIVAGTDTLGEADTDSLTLPNLHRELELLVRIGGLTPAEALAGATRNAAVILGAGEERGTIAPGKLADLVVLAANPLADISNTRSVQLVVKRGRLYRR